jgi:hypothetical protein
VSPAPTPIPVGDLRLLDHYKPGIDADTWYLTVAQTVLEGSDQTQVNTKPLGATQEVVVTAPQFSIDKTEVVSVHPPASSTGDYGDVLPHVVLREPMLPWERMLGTDKQPWLALLTLEAGEVGAAGTTGTGAVSTTVGQFQAVSADGTVLTSGVTPAPDVDLDDPMAYVEISTTLFQEITPRLEELSYLAHCRQVNTGDKATLGLDRDGMFSVVAANRFPAAPAADGEPAIRTVVHLVSLEGFEDYLVEQPSFGKAQTVALVSLASWSFWTLATPEADFRGLMKAIVAAGQDASGVPKPDNYRLRRSSAAIATGPPEAAEAVKRIDDGFVPVPYTTRSGEGTLAWYRGPLTPYPAPPSDRTAPLPSADAAIAYEQTYGVFDLSLGAAYQIGRTAALADPAFGPRLLEFRRAGHQFTDALLQRLESDAFTPAEIESLSGASVDQELRSLLKTDLLADLGTPVHAASTTPSPAPGPDATPQAALASLLADPDVQDLLTTAVASDLDPIATWLGRLLLLYPVPFQHLVPSDDMLPPESLRFFDVDRNWLDAMADGAVSIGSASSRDTFFQQIVGDVVLEAAYDALETFRESLPGTQPVPPTSGAAPMTGLLLRSAVVSGWPNLAVRACDHQKNLMTTLRMDHLSPTVLLCIFSGTPTTVTIAEPQEGLEFGLDQDGRAALRNVVAPRPSTSDLQIGEQFNGDPTLQVRDTSSTEALCLRDTASRVLDLSPGSPTGLVQKLAAAVQAQAASTPPLTPATFAIQMIAAPEAVDLTAPSAPTAPSAS